jgi:hypothetical protein
MSDPISRRSFTTVASGLALGSVVGTSAAQDKPKVEPVPGHCVLLQPNAPRLSV